LLLRSVQRALQERLEPEPVALGRGRICLVREVHRFGDAGLIEAERNHAPAAFERVRTRAEIDQVVIERADQKVTETAFRGIRASDGIALDKMKKKSLGEIFSFEGVDPSGEKETEERFPV